MFSKKMNELPQSVLDFISAVGRLSEEKKVSVYLVGGFVRDLMLKVKNFDMDFVVEGDAILFATQLAKIFSYRILTHRRFGTATLTGCKGFKVDFASCRRETYEAPAALPNVMFGSVNDDLLRRDFTINAMAIRIHARGPGELIDRAGGKKDLNSGVIRALYPLSFVDDPTRILRAVRFEQRFGFRIEKETRGWIKHSVGTGALDCVQKHRVRDELVLLFKEDDPVQCLRRLHEISGLSFIATKLKFQKQWKAYFLLASKKIAWFAENFHHKKKHVEPTVMFLSLVFYCLPLGDLKKFVHAYAFHKYETSRIISLKSEFQKVHEALSLKNVKPSLVYRLLEPLTYEVILAMTVLSKNPLFFERVKEFLFFYNDIRLHVKGEDLKAAGLMPGPVYKKILEELLSAKIDGEVSTKEEELEFLKKMLHRQGFFKAH